MSSQELAGDPVGGLAGGLAGELALELIELMRRGPESLLSDGAFNDLALRVFRFQCRTNQAYAGFVSRRGLDPQAVAAWESIPFLPTRAFKAARLVSGDQSRVELVFRTSGTTSGTQVRGEHHVLSRVLYRESLLPNFAAHLIPDLLPAGGPDNDSLTAKGSHSAGDFSSGNAAIPILSLLPSPESTPDSSLSFMMGSVVEAFGSETSGFFLRSTGEVDCPAFFERLSDLSAGTRPVLVAGTAFAFVAWLDHAEESGYQVSLPEGSRIMETGGYKGRSRALRREDLYRGLSAVFGVEESLIVNEYGMTELLSQFYEPHLATNRCPGRAWPAESPDLAHRFHRGPPWTRTRVLDPMTLEPKATGEIGVLAHMDLANLGSVSSVLTEDLGREVPGGFQLVGRSPGSEPRGCSLAMEDFLASREAGP